MRRVGILITIFLLLGTSVIGQQLLSGNIFDEQNVPIPFAKIFVKNSAEMRTVTDANGYYEMRLFPGEYFLVINASGYNERETYVVLNEAPVKRDIQLFPITVKELQDVEVSVKKSNPGREIMLKVVNKRDSISPWNYSHTVDGYKRGQKEK
jgi:hypothetical protein